MSILNGTINGVVKHYSNSDPKVVIPSKPRKAIVFQESIEHLGETSSRNCKVSRFSLSLKFSLNYILNNF